MQISCEKDSFSLLSPQYSSDMNEHPLDYQSKRKMTPDEKKFRRLCFYSAFAFGVIFVTVILIIAVILPEPTAFQLRVFNIILSLAGAGVATSLTGALMVDLKGIVLATEAAAVFVILFFFNPVGLAASSGANPPKDSKPAEGKAGEPPPTPKPKNTAEDEKSNPSRNMIFSAIKKSQQEDNQFAINLLRQKNITLPSMIATYKSEDILWLLTQESLFCFKYKLENQKLTTFADFAKFELDEVRTLKDPILITSRLQNNSYSARVYDNTTLKFTMFDSDGNGEADRLERER